MGLILWRQIDSSLLEMYDCFKIKYLLLWALIDWHYCIVCSPISFLILWSLTMIRWHFKKDQEETQTLKFITLNLNIVPIFAPSSSLHQHTKERSMTMAEEMVCEWCLGDCRGVGMLWVEKRCWWAELEEAQHWNLIPPCWCLLFSIGPLLTFLFVFCCCFSSYMCAEI